jgi:hypothetical protein
MKKNYLADAENKKRTTKNAMWILLIFILVFVAVIARVALR